MSPEAKAQQRRNDLQYMASTASGRRILAQIMVQARVWKISFVADSPTSTEFQEGMRAIGLALYNDLNKFCPKSLLQILGEIQNEAIDSGEPEDTEY